MSKSDTPRDGLYTKIFVATIIVIWVSLVGGNWLGHYIVEKGMLGKAKKTEYRAMPNQRPKPWITVDPKQVEAVEQITKRKSSILPTTTNSTPKELVTSTPVDQGGKPEFVADGSATPKVDETGATLTPSPNISATPVKGPAAGEVYQLQFGSFSTLENAKRKADELVQMGHPASVEEIGAGNSKVFRVRGGAYSEEEAKMQRDRLKEKNVEAYIVIKSQTQP